MFSGCNWENCTDFKTISGQQAHHQGIDFTSTQAAGFQSELAGQKLRETFFMFNGDLEHFGLFYYNYLRFLGRSTLLNGAILDVKPTRLATK